MKKIKTIEDLEMCLNSLNETSRELNSLNSVKTPDELFYIYGAYKQLAWQYLWFLQAYCSHNLPSDLIAEPHSSLCDTMVNSVINNADELLNDDDFWFNLASVFLYMNETYNNKEMAELNQYQIMWHATLLEFAFGNLIKINNAIIDIIKTNYN
jgi:hypothetical protein